MSTLRQNTTEHSPLRTGGASVARLWCTVRMRVRMEGTTRYPFPSRSMYLFLRADERPRSSRSVYQPALVRSIAALEMSDATTNQLEMPSSSKAIPRLYGSAPVEQP